MTFDLHEENFNSAHNFLPLNIGLSYLACVFLMTISFRWYHNTWPWPCSLTYIRKTLTLHITFLPLDIGLSYLASVFFIILWQDLSDGTINFDHVTLTVTFDLHLKKHWILHWWSFHQDLSGGNTSFDHIHIKYHIEMSPLMPHAFLGMLPIFLY